MSQQKILLDSTANFDQDFAIFHVETIRKVYRVSIYILLSQNAFANNKKGNTTTLELTALPIHL